MKLLTYLSTAVIALSVSTTVLANDEPQKFNPHSVGLQWGGGGLEYKNKDTDGEGVAQSYLYYNYQFVPHFYAEIGVMGGNDIDWECDTDSQGNRDCYSDNNNKIELDMDNFDFGAVVVALKTDLVLSKRNSLYAKVGAMFYDYQFDMNRNQVVDEDGTGLLIEGGWQYRWDNGWGINASFQNQNMDDLKISTFNMGVSFAF